MNFFVFERSIVANISKSFSKIIDRVNLIFFLLLKFLKPQKCRFKVGLVIFNFDFFPQVF